jgi:hypothetical protein
MNDKRTQQVSQAAAPHLHEGEQIEISAFANIGRVSVKRRAATAAAVGVATGGLLVVSVRPRKAYLAMTNQRLVFLDGDTMSGRPGKLLLTLPRSAVTVSDVKKASSRCRRNSLSTVRTRDCGSSSPGLPARMASG